MLSRLHFGRNNGNSFSSVLGKSCNPVFAPHIGHKIHCFFPPYSSNQSVTHSIVTDWLFVKACLKTLWNAEHSERQRKDCIDTVRCAAPKITIIIAAGRLCIQMAAHR